MLTENTWSWGMADPRKGQCPKYPWEEASGHADFGCCFHAFNCMCSLRTDKQSIPNMIWFHLSLDVLLNCRSSRHQHCHQRQQPHYLHVWSPLYFCLSQWSLMSSSSWCLHILVIVRKLTVLGQRGNHTVTKNFETWKLIIFFPLCCWRGATNIRDCLGILCLLCRWGPRTKQLCWYHQ
jgi:hypothetical protein